eukprot:TRINITY_DN93_c0_g1_i1.p1 TRINITY_DN93_c0_g1~~TRINITY_DN93_c0_g1_i1.p1  ORF type:complete len:916 (-),score=211.61 TRINITY_DN93_c0_g1_i1:36-2783(-)
MTTKRPPHPLLNMSDDENEPADVKSKQPTPIPAVSERPSYLESQALSGLPRREVERAPSEMSIIAPSEVGSVSTAIGMQALQRQKIKAELELANQQRLVAQLRQELTTAQRESARLQTQAITVDELRRRCEQLQSENFQLQLDVKQAESKQRQAVVDARSQWERDGNSKHSLLAEQASAAMRAEFEAERVRIRTEQQHLLQNMQQQLAARQAEIQEIRNQLAASESDRISLELTNRGLQEKVAVAADSERQNALLQVELSAREQQLQQQIDERTRFESEARELRRRAEEAEGIVGVLKRRLEVSEQDANDKFQEAAEAKAAKDRLSKENARLQAQVQQMEEDTQRRKTQKASHRGDSEQAVREMQAILEALQKDKVDLLTQVKEANQQVEELANIVHTHEERRASAEDARREAQILKVKLGFVESENATLKHDMDSLNATVAELQSKCDALSREKATGEVRNRELVALQNSHKELQSSYSDAQAALARERAAASELRAACEGLQSELQTLEALDSERTGAAEHIMQLERQLDTQRDRADRLERALQIKEKELDMLVSNTRNEAETQRQTLEKELLASQRQLVQAQQHARECEMELESVRQAVTVLSDKHLAAEQQLQTELQALEQRRQNEHAELEAEIQDRDLALRDAALRAELAAAERQTSGTELQIVHERHLAEMRALAEVRDKEVREATERLSAARTMITEAQTEAQHLRQQLQDRQKEAERAEKDYEQRIQQSRQDLEAVRTELADMRQQTQTVIRQKDSLESQVRQFQEHALAMASCFRAPSSAPSAVGGGTGSLIEPSGHAGSAIPSLPSVTPFKRAVVSNQAFDTPPAKAVRVQPPIASPRNVNASSLAPSADSLLSTYEQLLLAQQQQQIQQQRAMLGPAMFAPAPPPAPRLGGSKVAVRKLAEDDW